MKPPLRYDEAFITSFVRYGEADCIVRLFTLERGRVNAFVRGGLKPSRSRGSMVQAPALAKVGLVEKLSSELFQLGFLELEVSSFALADNLRAFGFACYAAELVEIFLAEHEPHEEIFVLLKELYNLLAHKQTNACLLRSFELKLLLVCGYLPDLTDVADAPGLPVAAYDPVNSCFLAEPHGECIPFHSRAQKLALQLVSLPFSQLPSVEEDVLRMVGRIFSSRLKQVKVNPLKSVQFLRDLGV